MCTLLLSSHHHLLLLLRPLLVRNSIQFLFLPWLRFVLTCLPLFLPCCAHKKQKDSERRESFSRSVRHWLCSSVSILSSTGDCTEWFARILLHSIIPCAREEKIYQQLFQSKPLTFKSYIKRRRIATTNQIWKVLLIIELADSFSEYKGLAEPTSNLSLEWIKSIHDSSV